jgi:hypothetical protein
LLEGAAKGGAAQPRAARVGTLSRRESRIALCSSRLIASPVMAILPIFARDLAAGECIELDVAPC